MPIVVAIMAGGRGERFWPASRNDLPKQFLDLGRGRTLFQEAVARIQPLTGFGSMFPVTGTGYVDLVRRQSPEIPHENIIVEPMARDTAACLALAAFQLRVRYAGADPVMIVLASDHIITDDASFRRVLRAAARVAESEDCVVVLGIPPTYPATGYGYIRYKPEPVRLELDLPVHEVGAFREKPNRETVQEYLATGNYLWNSGMFVWRLSYFLELLAKHLPGHYGTLASLFAGTQVPAPEALAEAFGRLERISIDYGLMEKTDHVKVIPAEIGWDDVGNWSSIAAYLPCYDGNAVIGDATLVDSHGCVVYADNGHIAAVGLRDMVVVRVGESILVCPKDRAQDVKQVVEVLHKRGRNDLL